ncbi:hypothetical protein GCM10011359_28450 [Nesterenkonia alkaliphila]|nr:hypothetical protein GCM10011359_28450 [Nesterenkonia alkaliphila]
MIRDQSMYNQSRHHSLVSSLLEAHSYPSSPSEVRLLASAYPTARRAADSLWQVEIDLEETR